MSKTLLTKCTTNLNKAQKHIKFIENAIANNQDFKDDLTNSPIFAREYLQETRAYEIELMKIQRDIWKSESENVVKVATAKLIDIKTELIKSSLGGGDAQQNENAVAFIELLTKIGE